jgi:hypothetical protein
MNFSSIVTCAATMSCAMMMRMLPSVALLASWDPEPPALHAGRTDVVPTMAVPAMTSAMPTQWYGICFLRRKMTRKRPVKMTTDPRSIWKMDASVSDRPTYMSDVAVMSHTAGRRRTSRLKGFALTTSPPVALAWRRTAWKARRHRNSPRNMHTAWKLWGWRGVVLGVWCGTLG